MSFGNALTGFMQGLDPNRDLLKRMRQWDIERELRQQTQPMQTAGGKTYASTARPQDGTYGYWVSDAAPQQQQMLDEQERAFQPEGGLRRYRNFNNNGHEAFYDTEDAAKVAASQYNSVHEQLNRAAAIYAKYGDVDKSASYALKARGLQREDEAYKRQQAEQERQDNYQAAWANMSTVEDQNDREAGYDAIMRAYSKPGEHMQYETNKLNLNNARLTARVNELRSQGMQALQQGGLEGLVQWYSGVDDGRDFAVQRDAKGRIVFSVVDQNTGKVLGSQSFETATEAEATIMAMATANNQQLIDMVKLEAERKWRAEALAAQERAAGMRAAGSGNASDDTFLKTVLPQLRAERMQAMDMFDMAVEAANGDPKKLEVAKARLDARLRQIDEYYRSYGARTPAFEIPAPPPPSSAPAAAPPARNTNTSANRQEAVRVKKLSELEGKYGRGRIPRSEFFDWMGNLHEWAKPEDIAGPQSSSPLLRGLTR